MLGGWVSTGKELLVDRARNLRLLLVEDSEEDELLLVRELSRAGYTVDVLRVWTPEELQAALPGTWDVVISDWSMPRLDGLEAYRIVRNSDKEIPFIIVSGTIGEEIAVDALRAGVDDFMSKGKFARLGPAIERARSAAQVRRRERETAAELDRRRDDIERSERLLRVVLDSVPDAVIVADRERVLAANPAATKLLGVSPTDRTLDALDGRLDLLLPDKVTEVPRDRQPLPSALRGEAIDRQELFVRPRGSVDARFMRVTARPFSHASGINGAIAVFHDISRERAAQEQLLISDRMASVGMLAAGVAHEINNPLAAVFANVEMITSTFGDGRSLQDADIKDLQEMLEDARVAADRVRQIVRDLKIFSRAEEEELRAVDLRGMLESTLRMARNEIRHRARLVTEYEDGLLARGSESRLGQVFLNLIVNAAQAIPEGRAERNTITVTSRRGAGEMAVVEVRDTGAGMSPETLRRLFTPFFSTKPQGEGTGLGLAIAHRIVTSLGGTIEVESTRGKGTMFRVTLPIALEETEATARISSPGIALRRARILVIDDEAMIGVAIRRLLARDHDVTAVTRAMEAVERIRSGERYDVIVCDLMMPQMTGMELHAELTGLGQADKIIFLTGGAFTPAARHFLDRVPNQWIEKPFDAQLLRALINARSK